MAFSRDLPEPEINRANPTCFLFLVDQSGSMGKPWGKELNKSKAEGVADALNRLIKALVRRCSWGSEIRDFYYLGVIGYGGDRENPDYISLGFPSDALAGDVLCPVSQVGEHPLRVEQRTKRVADGAGGLVDEVVEFPVWFDPVAFGRTPMCEALRAAREVISGFVDTHPACYPPVVFNITDGFATDGDPEPFAVALQSIAPGGWNVSLLNMHISGQCANPFVFPNSELGLPDDSAQRLFRMSSPLTPQMMQRAQFEELILAEGARGFAFNADLKAVVQLLDIGTRVGPATR